MQVSSALADSGFHGYSLASLYPGMYQGRTQTDETIPEPEEQAAIAGVEDPVVVVDRKQKMGIVTLVIVLVALLFVFGRG